MNGGSSANGGSCGRVAGDARGALSLSHDGGFELLLSALADDRDRAGECYVTLRGKLSAFFERRRAEMMADCYADEVLDRATRKLEEGARVPDIECYCYGIARRLLLEKTRERIREQSAARRQRTFVRTTQEGEARERLLSLLDEAMQTLSACDRELVIAYYRDADGGRIRSRKALASLLGLRPNTLKIRAHRARARLRLHFAPLASG